MENDRDCTIIVNTCDAYCDIWGAFYTLFKRYWPDCRYPVVLNSESKNDDSCMPGWQIMNAPSQDISWTARLRNVVERVSSEYILIMLDDFFLTDYVDDKKFDYCLSWLNANDDASCITFYYTANDGTPSNLDGYELRPQVGKYKVNAVISLWRKSVLLKYLTYDENPWQFELRGTERSFHENDKFYIAAQETPLIFPYNFCRYGLFSGKWLKDTVSLFTKEHISMDFSIRGFFNSALYSKSASIRNVFQLDSSITAYYRKLNCFPLTDTVQLYSGEKINGGFFTQDYDLYNASQIIQWNLSTSRGFQISDLSIFILYNNNQRESVNFDQLAGNCLCINNSLIFNQIQPFLYIFPSSNAFINHISISGIVSLVEDNAVLNRSYYECQTDLLKPNYVIDSTTKLDRIAYSKIAKLRGQDCFSAINSSYKRIRSIFTQHGCASQFDTRPVRSGSISQQYTIDPDGSRYITWQISKFCGFALKNISIRLVDADGAIVFLPITSIRGGYLLSENTRVFLTNTLLSFMLPKKEFVFIFISAEVEQPIPFKYYSSRLFFISKFEYVLNKVRNLFSLFIRQVAQKIKKVVNYIG